MSCDDFVFPVDHVGIPFKRQYVSFRFDKEALQDPSKDIRLSNALDALDEQEEEKEEKSDEHHIIFDEINRKRSRPLTGCISVSDSRL